MARDKVRRTTRSKRPIRLQDSTGLLESILAALNLTVITPIEERITILEDQVATLLGTVIHTAELTLPRHRSGHVDVDGVFLDSQIGAPVLVSQGSPIDELDGVVAFAGRVRDRRTLRVVWQSTTIPPPRMQINYIIGNAAEESRT